MAIKLYALSTCPYCHRAREFLDEQGARYDLVEVDLLEGEERDRVVGEVKRVSGGTSFPVIVADDEVIVGFDRSRIEKVLTQEATSS